jgi:hypothetical protein
VRKMTRFAFGAKCGSEGKPIASCPALASRMQRHRADEHAGALAEEVAARGVRGRGSCLAMQLVGIDIPAVPLADVEVALACPRRRRGSC